MKTLAELEAIRNKTLGNINLRTDRESGTKIVVGMATCGIAAGARKTMSVIMDELSTRNLGDVTVTQTGCIGMCRLEPIVEVFSPGREKVTYVKVDAERAKRIISDHVVNNKPVVEYTIGAAQE